MKLALVGATGLVGSEMLRVLEERNVHVDALLPVASVRSVGKSVIFKGLPWPVLGVEEALAAGPDFALFSAGGAASLELAPRFAEVGAVVIDNSSAWRMRDGVPLVVPEVNAGVLQSHDGIIANPNCSTIQMVVALWPLHVRFGLKRIVVSTYQSVTGSGQRGVDQLMDERAGREASAFYPHRIDLNVLPQVDAFLDSGYTKEEMKMVNETRKIMGLPGLAITATTVRVPVVGGHSESVNVEFEKPITLAEVRAILQASPGVLLADDPSAGLYPMPLTAHGRDEVLVGRLRLDEGQPNTLNMWIVADNLRKGAATNAVQILERLMA